MMESEMKDRWLSVDEIGDYLGIKRDTVYKWISEKCMPAHKVGRLWKFKKEQVDTWVEAGGAAKKTIEEPAETMRMKKKLNQLESDNE